MENTKSTELRAIADGKRTFTAESYMEFKPPMAQVITSSIGWDYEFTKFIPSTDSVFFEITVNHFFQYLHPHGKKAQNEDQKEGGNRQDDEKKETGDTLEVFDGSGELVDTSNGIIHFHQQQFVFRGAVDMTGVTTATKVKGLAVIDRQEPKFTNIEANGLISGGSQNFAVAVTIAVVI
ncbi:MAG: hypothetical protein LLG02_11510 [Pelosinus sp.]|nr:hypothetical protein [Pelosinus sp.]